MKTTTATITGHSSSAVFLSVKTPTLPRFVQVLLDGKRVGTVSIKDMTEAQLRQLGESWTKELIALSAKLRANAKLRREP